ncbi:copper resistance system multicopper oxidase [Chromohalobacter canadensis]|uniref:copper resistance system multicopper oxidase n=1 Tax=Chromohalobacter canadensis TaxID=141389 RepID=UPI0021BF9980|nr:copper resistance system multicopper oxidase [Chromohalobacter canadensis]MCT8469204.1 copper resistance system multicopper oxidase [Chromohalobacter canadensis]MCT8472606.1 copper resistance system multicopper oxidase [Chromohalobacter canadensis]MCT8500059.1 copper resistance system multicopper oxidase [Chromohalobacter canadensis]
MTRSTIIRHPLSRRQILKGGAALGLGSAAAMGMSPVWANPWGRTNVYSKGVEEGPDVALAIRRESIPIDGKEARPFSINGSSPGPLIRLKEGQDAVLRVTNLLDEPTSIHWHGLILPPGMDGVPGVSFAGIEPGETFTYRFPVRQNGTYWYHSHSGLQEQVGHVGPLIIDAAEREPFRYDREHVLLLTDWTFEDPKSVFRNLKTMEGYYNFQERTIADFFADVRQNGLAHTAEMRGMWAKMRMSSRDIADVTGSTYTYLLNGHSPEENWSALFKAGERVRLRVINGSAMSYFDVRIPGLKMTVVAADGQPVQPVPVDEFRIGVAETYDVLVSPEDDQAYTIFAESMDRSGYARATLAPREGMQAEIPERRQIADRGMEAMSVHMGGMDHSSMSNMEGMDHSNMSASEMEGMDHSGMSDSEMQGMESEQANIRENGMLAAGEAQPGSRFGQPGIGIDPDERRVLVYRDLKSFTPWPDRREPGRELELHLTGNMERYMWSFDGKKFSEVSGPIHFEKDERLRLILINDTMMEHPIHLHGMWMELENGQGELIPRKHTLNVKPGERVSALITADAEGSWAFHCHLLYHMDAGMFRVVQVS